MSNETPNHEPGAQLSEREIDNLRQTLYFSEYAIKNLPNDFFIGDDLKAREETRLAELGKLSQALTAVMSYWADKTRAGQTSPRVEWSGGPGGGPSWEREPGAKGE